MIEIGKFNNAEMYIVNHYLKKILYKMWNMTHIVHPIIDRNGRC